MAFSSFLSWQDLTGLRSVLFVSGLATLACVFIYLSFVPLPSKLRVAIYSYGRFFYVSFLKPHTGDGLGGQQGALESFYKAQADVYDATRGRLLRGREEMLALTAAQLSFQASACDKARKPIWVDIGGGTGWNIETMQRYINVEEFFAAVYLVDYSPSLCEVARQRFTRLGWKNVTVVCQDARLFTLADKDQADLITMSYSLSMLPNFHVFIDAAASLLHPQGIISVVDFYVQSVVETTGRNYCGGFLQRHVSWLGRTFWRAWFDLDRVGLEGARRDYLEYRFGTLKSLDDRNYILGTKLGVCIPYYIFIGRLIGSATIRSTAGLSTQTSPYLLPRRNSLDSVELEPLESTTKESQVAVVNLASKLPLPSTFYQNSIHRVYYDETLRQHTQFKNEFIYAFTWEDSRIDQRLLKIDSDDSVLCITSAGDNLLDYLYGCSPRRIHAVDLNPNQNHLLELKVAAYQALPYSDFWKLFGEGHHPDFRRLVVEKMSPYMSSQALQFWINNTQYLTNPAGLYSYGGSGHAIKLVRFLFRLFGLTAVASDFVQAKTLNEQRELWPRIRSVLLNRFLHGLLVSSTFLWKAAGVPANQAQLITTDYLTAEADAADVDIETDFNSSGLSSSALSSILRLGLPSGSGSRSVGWMSSTAGEAMWRYIADTLDPVARETLVSDDNHYYHVCLTGAYSRRCHPAYVSARAHTRLSRPGAFAPLRIHTDSLNDVTSRLAPGSLTIAIIMDSMDWFDPATTDAAVQICAFNRALKLGGRVMLRSAGRKPWYIPVWELGGFSAKRVQDRVPGTCVDRVNMYASTWILTKVRAAGSDEKLEQWTKKVIT